MMKLIPVWTPGVIVLVGYLFVWEMGRRVRRRIHKKVFDRQPIPG